MTDLTNTLTDVPAAGRQHSRSHRVTISVSRPRAAAAIVIGLVAALLAVVPPPAADALDSIGGRPVPRVWDVQPAPGATVPAGAVDLAATAMALEGVGEVSMQLDGAGLDVSEPVRTEAAVRVAGRSTLDPGHHVASVRFTTADGQQHGRTWRFTVAAAGLDRTAGENRIATAARLAARDREPGAADAAVLARADVFADALAGVPLAFHLDGPMLLTASDRLSPEASSALQDLLADGATVHLLGGVGALSVDVADDVRALGLRVRRHAGESRFATAAAVADALPAAEHAVVVSGQSFPDALAVAAPAAMRGWPILLAGADTLPAATASALQGRTGATIVGGTAAVGASVADAVADIVGETRRISGRERYETAARVARVLVDTGETVSLASGEQFADALVGSLDAAHEGAPLLLTGKDALPTPTGDELATRAPQQVRLYGGVAAVSATVESAALAATRGEGPGLESADPALGSEIQSLDQIRLTFDHALDVGSADMSVWFDGAEIYHAVGTGDFDNTLVLTLGPPAREPALQVPYPVTVSGMVRDVDGQWRHVTRQYTFRKIAMARGDAGNDVAALQQRLLELGYWLPTPDGEFGSLTVQAVMAFQKYERLPVTGTADAATQARLAEASRPRGATSSGYVVEIDKTRQVLMMVRDGEALWTFNTSTGTEQPYNDNGYSGIADTPTGTFDVCHERDELRESNLGYLWRPKYYHCGSGIAVHGSTSVPSYPASHGCVRVTYPAMDFIWAQDLMPLGATVYVYGRYPGT